MSNFDFLREKWPILCNLGELAEKNIYNDSNTSFTKMGMFAETLVKYIISYENIDETLIAHDNSHVNRIKLLDKEGLISDDIKLILDIIRKRRNNAVHKAYENQEESKVQLGLTYKLAVWFMQTYGDWSFEEKEFVIPKEDDNKDIEKISREYEEKVKNLEKELILLRKNQSEEVIKKRREEIKFNKRKIDFTEKETRQIIDSQLREAGWEADTINLRYSKGVRPEKGRNLAIAEWPTSSKEKSSGFVDYALFIGEDLVGFIEAKRYSKDVSGNMIESKNYAKAVKEEHSEYVVSSWRDYKVPFLFTSNGRKYVEEIKEKSGIHFLDCRKPTNHPKILHGWYSPSNLKQILSLDIEKANKDLDKLSFDVLKDPDGVGLRYYQVEAIKAVEQSIIEGKQSALLAMATGTGKTRTVLGLIYRLLVTKRFKRILFLIDRTELGRQALETFEEVKVENLLTLNQLYNINGLDKKLIDEDTKIHIATVQAMVKRIMYNDTGENIPSVGDYDCIIIDEAHRGYILDKEMTTDELEWRDNKDFLSKYKKIIDYFNGFKVALTATPALHTTQIFGKPVYSYTYRNAVIDGYLVDHEPPHIIETELLKEGIHFKKGDSILKYNTLTGELLNGEEIKDDLDFEIDSFNKKILVESHTRTALKEVAKYISPEDDGKTLIFATNDAHADMIVRILKEIFDEISGGVDDDAILKITGSIKDPELAIKKFKNERYPNIAITVDLLTTGIDVPKIDKLVFLRRVKSRILYEQMMGRATRICEDINKTHFEIFDCVNLYEALKGVTNMKPVVVDAKESFKIIQEEILNAETLEQKDFAVKKFIAKFQRKKKLIREKEKAIFKTLSNNKEPQEFIENIKNMSCEKARDIILDSNELIEYLDKKSAGEGIILVSNKEDKLISHTRGYGLGKKPEDYLNEFKTFIEENANKILALQIVCTKPKDLTREGLKGLKSVLDNKGFSEEYLKTAWRDLSNEDIAADIIAFIRQQALGSPLISNEERVKNAIKKINKEYNFIGDKKVWIKRIEKFMLKEVIIDRSVFDMGSFKNFGGFERANKVFNGELDDIIDKLKTYMFDERGAS
ncbi:hypothetical protein CLOHAE12215_01836 [Clostridium haemolyticum]|uniref:type I restriction-modification system endonuclease n=1 Tax=Clostridium haemolyticum TaxID=84025 RepID=UPI001C395F4F|nr:type I restriction-modification system endonuclease [Clostridium haemolyticum]CAG7840412.1 hypothetical protein CLOHAE12215_01836 [Clostridium haemolyticum]